MTWHILVATDGSELSDKAVVYALEMASGLQAKVTAVTVSEIWSPADIASKVRSGHAQAVSEYEEHAAEEAQRILAHAKEIAAQKNVEIETVHISDSHPAEGIIQAAEQCQCNLIVMASHGRRGISRLLLGSQAQEVLSLSKTPVLICK